MKIEELKNAMRLYLEKRLKGRRSKMCRAIINDAIDLTSEIEEVPTDKEHLREILLNGASDWYEYSFNGNGLCYDGQIAEHYLTAWRVKAWEENRIYISSNKLLEIQAEALEKSARAVVRAYLYVMKHKDERQKGEMAL